jgi:hypothetical protein
MERSEGTELRGSGIDRREMPWIPLPLAGGWLERKRLNCLGISVSGSK